MGKRERKVDAVSSGYFRFSLKIDAPPNQTSIEEPGFIKLPNPFFIIRAHPCAPWLKMQGDISGCFVIRGSTFGAW